MNPNPQTSTQQPNQQKGQPDVRGQNPDANKQAYGQPGKPGYDTQNKQQSSARPQDEEDEEAGSSCASGKDPNMKNDPYKKTGSQNS